MEDGDLADVVRSWAEGKGGGSGECWVLLIEEKMADKVVEILLTNVFSKCLE